MAQCTHSSWSPQETRLQLAILTALYRQNQLSETAYRHYRTVWETALVQDGLSAVRGEKP